MITYAALSPHPPLIVPQIGRERIKDVQATVNGMQQMARELVATSPETIIFLSPHGNVFADCISCLNEPELRGDFGPFGNKKVGTSAPNDLQLLAEIEKLSADAGISFIAIDKDLARNNRLNPELDHGILVPMHYIEEAGIKDIPIVAISIGFLPIIDLYAFGKVIKDAAEEVGRRVAIIASGDMSHRLKNEAPYDYHPDGPRFDYAVKDIIEAVDVASLLNIPENMRENAGECGYRSLVIMFGALDGISTKSRVFSYEGPFGVGYLTAGILPIGEAPSMLEQLMEEKQSIVQEKRQRESMQVKWARMVLETYVKEGKLPELPPEMEVLRQEKAGAFVSLKKNGQLRGCIGTIISAYGDLAEEIEGNAISAGTKDPRFLPVNKSELDAIVYSVDVLGEAEPCSRDDLAPHQYGVIVSHGHKRGLLLPDLEGVDTVEKQLAIALDKAGISPAENYSIERFIVKRYT